MQIRAVFRVRADRFDDQKRVLGVLVQALKLLRAHDRDASLRVEKVDGPSFFNDHEL